MDTTIQVQNLSKSYGEQKVLQDINFDVKAGEVVGLLGKNGAGKTTILKAIAGLSKDNGGHIMYQSKDILTTPNLTRDFGILIECAFLDYLSAYENLKVLLWAHGLQDKAQIQDSINKAFKLVGLEKAKNKKVKQYSFGMKQRLGLAQAITLSSSFMMLDEPFVGLDPIGKEIAKNAIIHKAKQENMAVLFSSHDLDDVSEICDKIVMIEDGHCIYNGPMENKKKYTITINHPLGTNLIAFLSSVVPKLKVQNNQIEFYSQIDTVLKELYKNNVDVSDFKIDDINVVENSLLELFKMEK